MKSIRKNIKFNPGQVVVTVSINDRMLEDPFYSRFIVNSLQRHLSGDWGELEPEDKHLNDISLDIDDPGQIFSAYQYGSSDDNKIWIITEWDRSYTTILLPCEY